MLQLLSRPLPRLTPRHIVIAVVSVAAVLAVLHLLDARLAIGVRSLPPAFVAVMAGITDFGQPGWILYPSLLVALGSATIALLAPSRRLRRGLLELGWLAAFVFAGVGLPSLATDILKRPIGRARPQLLDQVGDFSFLGYRTDFAHLSFPSGHTTTAFAFAVVVSLLVPRLSWVMLAFAVLIAWTRIATGMHYLTDVTGGAIVGSTGAYLVAQLFVSRGWAFRRYSDGALHLRIAALRRLLRPARKAA